MSASAVNASETQPLLRAERAWRRLSRVFSECVFPEVCKNLSTDHSALIQLYRKARAVPGGEAGADWQRNGKHQLVPSVQPASAGDAPPQGRQPRPPRRPSGKRPQAAGRRQRLRR
ncbi:hypothetical protein CCR96_22410 [Halochromatium roseum]|nr:hypothetical protein [Halochromatium roseum]